jgi:hypothetical protein
MPQQARAKVRGQTEEVRAQEVSVSSVVLGRVKVLVGLFLRLRRGCAWRRDVQDMFNDVGLSEVVG